MARLMPRLPIREESQRHLTEGDRKWKPKAALRIISTFLAFLAMILFAVCTGMTVRWEHVLYNPIALFLLIRYRRGKAYHPGFDVAIDLIIWGISLPSIVFSVGDGWFWWWQPVELEFDTPIGELIPCDDFNFWSRACQL